METLDPPQSRFDAGEFYRDFAAAFGTLWLGALCIAFVAQTHLDLGLIGGIGFPVAALVYAAYRSPGRAGAREALRRRIAELEGRLEIESPDAEGSAEPS